jgi:hypothetical protein
MSRSENQKIRNSVQAFVAGLTPEDKNILKQYLQLDKETLEQKATQFLDLFQSVKPPKLPNYPTTPAPNWKLVKILEMFNPLKAIEKASTYRNAVSQYHRNVDAYDEYIEGMETKQKEFLKQHQLYLYASEMKRLGMNLSSGGARKTRRRKLRGKTRRL